MKITYNTTSRRHMIGDRELHCGDCFEMQLAGHWLPVTYEASWLGASIPKVILIFDNGSFGELRLQMPALAAFNAR